MEPADRETVVPAEHHRAFPRRRVLVASLLTGVTIVGGGAFRGDPVPGAEAFTQTANHRASNANWKLAMRDDFDSLDSSRWMVYDNESWDRDDARVLARNVSVGGGLLRVRAKHESVAGRRYTTGDLTTAGRFTLPNYFKVDVRAKIPLQHGMWAAPLWFRPADDSPGEIDLVETYGGERADPRVHQTIHSQYGSRHQQTSYSAKFSQLRGEALGWHTYTVAKTPGHLRMWVDGVRTADFDASTTSWYNRYYEAGKRWDMRICLQVGGWDVRPDGTTNWSADTSSMKVARIRAWVPR